MSEQNSDNKPYLDENGDLIIPFSCADHRFKYWKQEGMSLKDILGELEAAAEVVNKYVPPASQ